MAHNPADRVAGLFFPLGLAGLVYAWTVIGIAAYLNPWFSITSNAFSDLGGPLANMPWVFNIGMMSVAVLIALYSWSLAILARNKTQVAGSVFFLTSGAVLFLIGYFHEGTYPHLFVSYWFFIQSAVAVIAWGAGLMLERNRAGLPMLLLGIVSPVISAAVPWPSIALLEAFGIVVIDIWTAAMAFVLHKRSRSVA